MLKKVKKKIWINPFVQIYAKIQWVLSWPMSHQPTLLDRGDNVTSLVKITNYEANHNKKS